MDNKIFLIYIYIYIYLNILKNNYYIYYFFDNKYNNYFLKYYYIYYYICFYIVNNINNKFSYFCFKQIKNKFLVIKNNKLLIYLELYKKKNNINKYNYYFFYKKNNNYIYLYNDIKFKIELFFLLSFRDHIEYIRIYKYHEYLNNNSLLYNYPLLKMFLRYLIKFRINKIYENESYFLSQNDFFNKYQIYHYQIDENNNNKLLNINKNIITKIKLNFNNNEILKLLLLFEKNIKIFIYFEYNLYNLSKINYIYLFWLRKIGHYEITIEEEDLEFNHDEDDWTDIEKTTDLDPFLIYNQINKYGFDINYYYLINILFYFINIFINKIIKIFNILEIIKISKYIYIIKNILNLFWYKIIEFICVDFMSALLFYFSLANSYFYRFITDYEIKIYCSTLYNRYSFAYFPLNYKIYYNKDLLFKYILNNKKNYDYFYWKMFFIGNIDYRNIYNYNIYFILNKLYIDNNNNNIYILIINLFIKYIYGYYKENNIINYYHYILLIFDIIKQILIKYKKLYNIKIVKYKKFLQYKNFLYFYKTYIGLNNWFNYYKKFRYEWIWKYEKIIIYTILLLFLWMYYYFFIIILFNYWHKYLNSLNEFELVNKLYNNINILLYL